MEGKERKLLMTTEPKDRILINGESHVRGYAEKFSDNLGHSFNVIGYVCGNIHMAAHLLPLSHHSIKGDIQTQILDRGR